MMQPQFQQSHFQGPHGFGKPSMAPMMNVSSGPVMAGSSAAPDPKRFRGSLVTEAKMAELQQANDSITRVMISLKEIGLVVRDNTDIPQNVKQLYLSQGMSLSKNMGPASQQIEELLFKTKDEVSDLV